MNKNARPMKPKKGRSSKSMYMGLLDVALTLGTSIDTARRYALSGKLPSVRIAGKIRVPREAVERALREGV